jgi:2-ketoarginine methyltransferase
MLTDGFETRLIQNTQPVRHFFLAQALHHAMHVGLFAALADEPGATGATLAGHLGLDTERTEALLRYLRAEGYCVYENGWSLSTAGTEVGVFAPWYEMLVGGYASSMQQLEDVLRDGTRFASRDTTKVGEGSCGIAVYDALPLVEQLLAHADVAGAPKTVVDLGCGDGSFLMDVLAARPGLKGIGVEPHAGSVTLAEKRSAERGLQDRLQMVQGGAHTALELDLPDQGQGMCFMTAFVLQEVMKQEGQQAIEDLLVQTFERYPQARWLVVEMDHQPTAPVMSTHGLAQTFYNPYFLIHSITEQQLETRDWWDKLFDRLGLVVEIAASPDPRADTTGLQFGVLLSKRP